MAGKVTDEQMLFAAYFLLASKRFSRDFMREKDESIAKVLSALSDKEVEELGDIKGALSEIDGLVKLGIVENIQKMANTWEMSRHLRG
jgi:hypothetical protein